MTKTVRALDPETRALVDNLETLLQETRDRNWLTSAGAVETAISRVESLADLQAAAEPLAGVAEQWDDPRSGEPRTKDDTFTSVSLGALRSLARSLRSSRGGEAEPPRRPSPPTPSRGVPDREVLFTNLVCAADYLARQSMKSQSHYIGSAMRVIRDQDEEIARLAAATAGLAEHGTTTLVDVLTMRTTAGSDYYVRIRCGGREMTPYMFRDRYKAEYEAAHFAWLLGLTPDEPSITAYTEEKFPSDKRTTGRVEQLQAAYQRNRDQYEAEVNFLREVLARAVAERQVAERERDDARSSLRLHLETLG